MRLESRLSEAHDPPLLPSPDRVPREQEAFEKEWALLPLGEATLQPGRNLLHIRAEAIPGSQVAECKGVVVRRGEM